MCPQGDEEGKMKPVKFAKRAALAGLVTHGLVAASFKPTLKELFDPNWHMEIPMRLVMGRGMAWLLPNLYARYGERGVKRLQYFFYQFGLDRAATMQKYLQIDPDDARSLGRILDYEDGLGGVRGTWVEESKGKATKEERYCPIARELEKCPEVCTKLMMAMEAGTFVIINPRLEIPEFDELLSTGGSCCKGSIELAYLTREEAAQESPHATHDAFPPVLKVPGLQWRLMGLGVISMFKAACKLLTTDIDDIEMYQYDFIRYEPPR
jgi:hypothetical protein